eukprot:15116901-Heterocapsa_arctica.AAC.1
MLELIFRIGRASAVARIPARNRPCGEGELPPEHPAHGLTGEAQPPLCAADAPPSGHNRGI